MSPSLRQTKPKPRPHATGAGLARDGRGTPASLSRQALEQALQAHQVELAHRNKELLRTQADLAMARDRYVDLFDAAPVGYLTLDRREFIVEANLTAAARLGMERKALLGLPFARLVRPSDADRWQRLATTLHESDARQIDLALRRPDGQLVHARLHCWRDVRAGSKPLLHVAVTDASLRLLAERNRRIAATGNRVRMSERRAMANQLHEDLGQRLGILKMQLGTLPLSAGDPALLNTIGTMSAEIDEALDLVRRMSRDLHPLMLDQLGLHAALDWLTRDVAARLGLRTELQVDDDDTRMDDTAALALYRLTEMALEHFARHVEAVVTLELLRRSRDWVLRFQVAPGPVRSGGRAGDVVDLPQAIQDQVHLLRGRVEVGALPSGVRTVSIVIAASAAAARGAPDAGRTR